MDPKPIKAITSYHAHIYFRDAAERERAIVLREQISARFAVKLGRWHDKLVGPHALPMYQVAFVTEVFATLVPWLMLNRQGLVILVHPNTENSRQDHLAHPIWMGEILSIIRPEQLRESPDGEPAEDLVPNSSPTLIP